MPGLKWFLFALFACPVFSYGQSWPQRPIRVVVPFPPGGVTDSIAPEFVARSEPDGYTLLSAATPQLAVVPYVQKISYDPLKDFAPISIVGTNPFALGCNTEKLPAKNLGEFVGYVKERQGQLSFASA